MSNGAFLVTGHWLLVLAPWVVNYLGSYLPRWAMIEWEWKGVLACSHGPAATFTSKGCPGWHSARSCPEVMMNINTAVAPLFTQSQGVRYGLPLPAGAKRPVSCWRPSRRALSGEGLAAAGILARQQERELRARADQRMTYIWFLAPAELWEHAGVPEHSDKRVRLGSWGQYIMAAAVARGWSHGGSGGQVLRDDGS